MNWFKKLFAQLNDDVDSDQGEIEQKYAEKPEEKKMQAKIAYQYPTGKFRFPLIPDEELQQERPILKAKRTRKSPVVEAKKEEQKKNVSPIVEEVEKPATKVEEKKKEKVILKNKKPFQPTEVVSPVFGYSSRPPTRKVKAEILPELELISEDRYYSEKFATPSIMVESAQAASNASVIDLESKKVQAFSNLLIKEIEEKENESLEEKQKDVMEVEILDDIQDQSPFVQEERREQDKTSVIEPIEDKIDAMEPIVEDVAPIEMVEVLENGKDPEVDSRFEIESLPIEEKKEEETLLPTTTVSSVKERHHSEHEQAEISSFDKTPWNQGEKEEPKSNSLPGSKSDTLSNKTKESKKQHIPFNVIMLKQDKRSFEKRKQETTRKPEEPAYYVKPPITLLSIPKQNSENDREWVESQRRLLDETLHHFRIGAKVVKATQGPSVTQFEVQPDPGVKVNKITNLSDDIKLSLSARDIRIEAPIPGKNTIGIEVPNRVSKAVLIREIIRHPSFLQNSSPLTVALGLDISGQPVVLDLQKMPHGLIAGATGSGKSVCVNSIIISLLYKSTPSEVKLLLIDPKMVELTPYNHIPHLVSPVITDVKAATAALKWAVEEMERRYALFVHAGVRDIARYNEVAKKHNQETLPYMVIIIDELADLMMVAPSDVEEAICRIAQKARACGMHLLIATQRPSVDVITGLIKANIPTRIAFSVSSQVDSRTIIDIGGAERLLGKGDMLLLENGAPKPVRVQGNFVSDEEIEKAVSHVRKEQKPNYLFDQSELLKESTIQEEDELFLEACHFVIDQNVASTSSLQRRFRIGYNRAARLMEMMEDKGVISGSKGSKPRDVLISDQELISMQDSDY